MPHIINNNEQAPHVVTNMMEKQAEEFFKLYREAMVFNQFVEKIENETNKTRFLKYYQRAKKLADNEELKSKLTALNYDTYLLAIAADWCWDSQSFLPTIQVISEMSPRIELRILIKEQYRHLQPKVNGGEKQPFVWIYGSDGYPIEIWFERPASAYKLYGELRKQLGWEDNDVFYREYRKQFLRNQDQYYLDAAREIIERIIRANYVQSASRRINTNK